VQNRDPIRRRSKRSPRPSEEGYLLLAVMFLLFLLAISLTVAVPRLAKSIQRDHDVETMERGKQYIRAVQLYYRKFHAYPPSADALVKTNDIRFLRKKYIDPETGKDDWKPIMFGQNKVPIAMGFFGQPLAAGSSIGGIGPTGGNGMNGLTGNTSNALFPSSAGNFGSSTTTTSSGGSSSDGSTPGTTVANGQAGTTGAPGTSGTSGSDSTGSSSSSGTSGQTFGGAGIIGFEPASSKQSILVWKKKDHYNEWEFTYDPIMDMRTVSSGGAGLNGQPASSISSPIGSPTGTTPGATTGTGTSQTPPPDTTSPPQQ
jgi:type II secretory pathway pseudopilin PulG